MLLFRQSNHFNKPIYMGIFNKFKDTFTSAEFDDIEKDLVKAISKILAVTPPV